MSCKKITLNRAGVIPVLFLFLLFGNLPAETSPRDSLKKTQAYDINDPRNPKCPCHEYQNIADAEYAALIGKLEIDEKGRSSFGNKKDNERNSFSRNNASQRETASFSGKSLEKQGAIKKKNKSQFFSYHKKKKDRKHNFRKKISGFNLWSLWKRNPNLDSCFSWK